MREREREIRRSHGQCVHLTRALSKCLSIILKSQHQVVAFLSRGTMAHRLHWFSFWHGEHESPRRKRILCQICKRHKPGNPRTCAQCGKKAGVGCAEPIPCWDASFNRCTACIRDEMEQFRSMAFPKLLAPSCPDDVMDRILGFLYSERVRTMASGAPAMQIWRPLVCSMDVRICHQQSRALTGEALKAGRYHGPWSMRAEEDGEGEA